MPRTALLAASAGLAVTAALAVAACGEQGSGTRLAPAPATEAQIRASPPGAASDAVARTAGRLPACSAARGKVMVAVVPRSVNHLLLILINTGSGRCAAYGYPRLRFNQDQAVTRVMPGSRPHAVVTLAPGQSAYATVRTSGADGSAAAGIRPARVLTVHFADASAAGTTGTPARLALPEGTSVDDSAAVSFWQATPGDALMW
ncbi:DUF4232 domain-containing protein [Streptoverticillium reticulum]|uniref:DUF4232 domain-containing protein n=1 Tax=Streptoverticillium reticulum TaxID=1433415 RepID=UPI0039BF616C